MSRSKHQSDPIITNESSDSGDENCNTDECSHINKAVDLNRIKKNLSKIGFVENCPDCCNQMLEDVNDLLAEIDESIWLCLKCGNQGCGRAKCSHALKHYDTPHSDSHALCINTTHWSIWCYDCDNSVNVLFKNRKKKLWDTVDYLKRQKDGKYNQNQFVSNSLLDKTIGVALTLPNLTNNAENDQSSLMNTGLELPRARGLTNLGNTCFFNSVIQCLGQTPYLLELLMETEKAGQQFRLPGGKLKLKNKDEIDLPPLEGKTEKWLPLMEILAVTLSELRSGRCEVFNPRNLLHKLVFRMPQFGSGEQHDSHELLRHLLEAVREEDQRRYKSVILSKLGYNNKTNPNTVDEDQKKIVKFYGQQVSEMLLATEQVFRGVLASTLQCQVCQHVSHREEKFLDLSLPIFEKQASHILRRKAEYIEEDNKPSKYQIKKEKRTERRKSKKQKHNNKGENQQSVFIDAPPTITLSDVSMDNKSESDESDADVEDNTEDTNLNNACNVIPLPAPGEDFPIKCESGYNSDKLDNCSPDSNIDVLNTSTEVCVDDSGVPSPITTTMNEILPNSPETTPSSSDANVDMNNLVITRLDEDYDDSTNQRPVSRLEFVENNNKNTDLKVDLEKLSLLNDGDSNKVDSIDNHSEKQEEQQQLMITDEAACATLDSTEMMDQDEDVEDIRKYSGTLAPRYYNDDGECSVESCLNQFTECELLMGVNRVGCDLCTKNSGTNKTVYRDVSKQLLISNPPAVLILHLKRFQVFRFRSTKVSKFVKFSTLLDIAPFCSNRIRELPNFDPLQTKVLYSLYGVVEHSGSIHGGHYVSYIKVRARLEEKSPRWNFIPKNQQQNFNTFIEMNSNQMMDEGNEQQPNGKWYYISDSHVAEVSESKVLSAQAYLLFYERLI